MCSVTRSSNLQGHDNIHIFHTQRQLVYFKIRLRIPNKLGQNHRYIRNGVCAATTSHLRLCLEPRQLGQNIEAGEFTRT